MTDQFLYGYRLSAADGSVSRWSFFNKNECIAIAHRLKNGVLYIFNDEVRHLPRWAESRGLGWEQTIFQFDPDTMTFTLKE